MDLSQSDASRVGRFATDRLAPVRIVLLLLTLTGCALAAAAAYLSSQPYLGIETGPAGQLIQVEQVSVSGPAFGRLNVGDSLVAIRHKGQDTKLSSTDVFAEPDIAEPTLGELKAYRERQGMLLALVSHADSQWVTNDGRVVPIEAAQHRDIVSLPLNFWFHGIVALLGIAISAGVWAYRQGDWAARGFLAMGLGLAIAAASAGMYTSRELALGSHALWLLGGLNQLGTQLYSGGYVVTMLRYPQVLGSARHCRWILWGFMLWAVIFGVVQPWDAISTDLAFRAPIVLAVCWALYLAARQWFASRHKPLERAALLWYFFAWFIGGLAFVAMQILPLLLGDVSPSETQVFAFGFLLLTNVGIALGVIRYRLFDLGTWWAQAWGAVLGGSLVIAVDVVLLSSLRLDSGLSLALSVALAGWVYFPLRQLVWRRLTRHPSERDEGALLKAVLRASGDNAQASWQRLLEDVFKPLEVKVIAGNPPSAAIGDDGASLIAPGPDRALELRWLYRGRRLARAADMQLVNRLNSLFGRIRRYREAVAEGAHLERQRIAQDLHDDIGARLLSVRQRADASTGDAVTEILADIRTIVHSLAGDNPDLMQCLADCRNELADRCEAAGIAWTWPLVEDLPDAIMPSDWSLDLTRIMRELTNNAIKHASPSRISVQLSCENEKLRFEFRHDAKRNIEDPDAWHQNLGLRNLGKRCRAHGGDIGWQFDDQTADVVFRGSLALPQNTGSQARANPAEYGFDSAATANQDLL